MANLEFEYPVVYFDWQEKDFIEGVMAYRAGKPNIKIASLEKDGEICLHDEAWIVGYRDADEDQNESVTCEILGIDKPETSPKDLFNMALEHTLILQRKRLRTEKLEKDFKTALEVLEKLKSPNGWGMGEVKLPGSLRERVPVKQLSEYNDIDGTIMTLNDDHGAILRVRFGRKYGGVESVSIAGKLPSKATREFDHDKLKNALKNIASNDEKH
jgi:hypothetical protein